MNNYKALTDKYSREVASFFDINKIPIELIILTSREEIDKRI